MDGKMAASGGPAALQPNGTATSKRGGAPTASLPAAKQKSSKNLPPTAQPVGRKQPPGLSSRPPTAPSGAAKMLNNGTARKASALQTKQPMTKPSATAATVANSTASRTTVKKGVGDKPSGLKTSEKLGQETERQQKTTKGTTQSTASGPKVTATKPKRSESAKPSRTWLPGAKNAAPSSSASSRAPASDTSVGKPKQTAPPAGQVAVAQQQKNRLSTASGTSRAAALLKGKPASSTSTAKVPPAPKQPKALGSKLQSEQNSGQRSAAGSGKLSARKSSEAQKPRTPAKATCGSVNSTMPPRALASAAKAPTPSGSSPGKKPAKKEAFLAQGPSPHQNKLQKGAANEKDIEVMVGQAESLSPEDPKPLEKLDVTPTVEAVSQPVFEEAKSTASEVEALGADHIVPRGLEEEDALGPSCVAAQEVRSPAGLEEAPRFSPETPKEETVSSPSQAFPSAAQEGPELPGACDGHLDVETALPCEASSPTGLEPAAWASPTPPESPRPDGEGSDNLGEQMSLPPPLEADVVAEQPPLSPGPEEACEDILRLSAPLLYFQMSAKGDVPLLSCEEGFLSLGFLRLEAGSLEESGANHGSELPSGGEGELSSLPAEPCPSAHQGNPPSKTPAGPVAAGQDGEHDLEGSEELVCLPVGSPEGELLEEAASLEGESERWRSPPDLGVVVDHMQEEEEEEATAPLQMESLALAVVCAAGEAWEEELCRAEQVAPPPVLQDQPSPHLPLSPAPFTAEFMEEPCEGCDDYPSSFSGGPSVDGDDDAVASDVGASHSEQEEGEEQGDVVDPSLCFSGVVFPASGGGGSRGGLAAQGVMPKPQSLPLKSLELLQEHPPQLPEAPGPKGFSPERGGSSSKSSTLSGPDLAGKSSSETSTPEELREYDSSSGVESKSDERLEQTCHHLLTPLEGLPGDLDLGIHMERGDDEAETLPADEVLGDPPTEPTVSSEEEEEEEEEAELDADLLKEVGFAKAVCLSASPPPGKQPPLPHSVEESDELGSGDAGTETPASTNSAASSDVFGAFHLPSTDSCGKSPGLSSLEGEEPSAEGTKDQLLQETGSETPLDWEHPLQVAPGPEKIGGQEEGSSQPFAAAHGLAAAGNV